MATRITNIARMTNTELRAALIDAVACSNRYFYSSNWRLSRYWHYRAVELQQALDRLLLDTGR